MFCGWVGMGFHRLDSVYGSHPEGNGYSKKDNGDNGKDEAIWFSHFRNFRAISRMANVAPIAPMAL